MKQQIIKQLNEEGYFFDKYLTQQIKQTGGELSINVFSKQDSQVIVVTSKVLRTLGVFRSISDKFKI